MEGGREGGREEGKKRGRNMEGGREEVRRYLLFIHTIFLYTVVVMLDSSLATDVMFNNKV